jgi:hypothetical protein
LSGYRYKILKDQPLGECNVEAKLHEISRIDRLAKQLAANKIKPQITAKILEGAEEVTRRSKPEKHVEWFCGAMTRMDALLDLETCKTVREGCACCLGGKREKMAKVIFKDNATLEDRIAAAAEAHYVFGHTVYMEDGKVIVQFFPEGLESYRCPCMPQAQDKTMPLSYCFCCGGHVKHHLQNALGLKLDCTTLYTARSTGGKKPCKFSFEIIE